MVQVFVPVAPVNTFVQATGGARFVVRCSTKFPSQEMRTLVPDEVMPVIRLLHANEIRETFVTGE